MQRIIRSVLESSSNTNTYNLIDESFDGTEQLIQDDYTDTISFRRKHNVSLAEEGNLYDCG